MIVSRRWLADYVRLPAELPDGELVERLLLSGLNHESTRAVGADTAIEIEVTSNRPDCLGHIGVAREAAVLFGLPLHVPDPRPAETAEPAAVAVEIEAGDICPYYSARVIRGVTVGPSPAWLAERLAAVGVASVNNVVDVTNYVMLECGQPLHAFDLGRLRGGRIVVRRGRAGEPFTAINHKTYPLTDGMAVIADAEGPVALAGVMGGARTEISGETRDVLLESAQFAPLPVRTAARGLVLSSPSSYRFERGPDPAAVDWASRRAAALILEVAGGRLAAGVAEAGRLASTPATIELRGGRVAEVLGADVPAERQQNILRGLGFVPERVSAEGSTWRAPSWRRDCSREIDLVEEIARVAGYDLVPENVPIAARTTTPSLRDVTVGRATQVLVAAGLCEALTRSVVGGPLETAGSPWGAAEPLVCTPPLVRGADRLRRSLVPSLLEARAGNAAVGNDAADLFEVARGYLARSRPAAAGESPVDEPLLLAFVIGGGFAAAKGLAEAVLGRLGVGRAAAAVPGPRGVFRPADLGLFAAGRSAEIVLDGGAGGAGAAAGPPRVGVVGEVSAEWLGRMALDGPVAAAEIRLDRLEFAAALGRELRRPSDFPAIGRDINLVVGAEVPWGDVAEAIASAGGELLEDFRLGQVWSDAERLGAGRKSFVVALRLRSGTGTLSGEEAGRAVERIVAACTARCGATLRA
jgi:phenylalanyl-tRNA synthetase beta chain